VDHVVPIESRAVETETSIGHLLAVQAERYPHAPAVVFSGGPPLTYGRLHQQVQTIGTRLRGAGIRGDDRVAVVLQNGPGMATAFLGVAAAAACAPLNPAYTASEFDFYLADLDARAVVVPSGRESPVREVAQKRGVAVLEYSDRNEPDGWVFGLDGPIEASQALCEAADPQAVALVLHTSGTTSRPKMIRLSHENICASAASIRSTLQLGESDRCLNVMPLFHIHGLIGALLASLAGGGSVVCTTGFSPMLFFGWLEEFSPTWYTAVPTMHQEVLARAAANRETIARCRLRFIRSSSAALSPDVMSGIERAFGVPVIEAFGMTEASHQIASNPLPPARRKPGSVGLPAGCEVAILDEHERSLPGGESGEIAIRGASVTRIRPVAGDETPGPADAGWFRTGDVGYVDEDGYLFISGRIKEMINRGGEKIAPSEVDHVLQGHPSVGQAVTCAVPDARLGEDVVAVVVLRPGSALTERELREFASTRLVAFKVPRRVMFVEQIPKGPTGKIQRIGLAKKLGIESLAFAQPGGLAPFEAPRTGTQSIIARAWSEVLAIDRVGLHDNFFELGGDSLMAVEVIARVKARLGVTINIRDLGFGTLQQVAAGCDEQAALDSGPGRRGHALARWVRKIIWGLRRDE
jgi:acyl-CoA synthetase (AMP-forming)/AMP-acid ligase II/acyl carrier protein